MTIYLSVVYSLAPWMDKKIFILSCYTHGTWQLPIEPPEQRGQLDNLGVDGNITFKLILKSVGMCWMESACSRWTPTVGCCGIGYKPYGPMGGEFTSWQTTTLQVYISFSVLIRRSFFLLFEKITTWQLPNECSPKTTDPNITQGLEA